MGKRARRKQRQPGRPTRPIAASATGGGPAGAPAGHRGGHAPGAANRWRRGDAAEVIEVIHRAAMQARRGYPHPLLVDQLVAGPPAGGSQLVDQVLVDQLQRAVTGVWPQGWMPEDVVRWAAVDTDEGSTTFEPLAMALAGEARRYAQATVAPRWRDQLAALGADPWLGQEPRWEPGTGPARPAGIRAGLAALSVLLVLQRQPAGAHLCPPPGAYREAAAGSHRPGPQPGGGGGKVDRGLLERVRALLAKAESTTFPAEAEAFTAKAQELMARHAIDQAMLAGSRPAGHQVEGRRLWLDNPYLRAKHSLLSAVARANRCRGVLSDPPGFTTVFGPAEVLDGVEVLFTSLLVQATSEMEVLAKRTPPGARERSRAFRRAFLEAYAQRIGERLREATRSAQSAAEVVHGASLLPVLASQDAAVEAAVHAAFPQLGRIRTRVSDGAGWAAGRAAADRASLSGHRPLHRAG